MQGVRSYDFELLNAGQRCVIGAVSYFSGSVQFPPSLNQALLFLWQRPSNHIDRANRKDPGFVLKIGVEMRNVMRHARFGEHAETMPKKRLSFSRINATQRHQRSCQSGVPHVSCIVGIFGRGRLCQKQNQRKDQARVEESRSDHVRNVSNRLNERLSFSALVTANPFGDHQNIAHQRRQ